VRENSCYTGEFKFTRVDVIDPFAVDIGSNAFWINEFIIMFHLVKPFSNS